MPGVILDLIHLSNGGLRADVPSSSLSIRPLNVFQQGVAGEAAQVPLLPRVMDGHGTFPQTWRRRRVRR